MEEKCSLSGSPLPHPADSRRGGDDTTEPRAATDGTSGQSDSGAAPSLPDANWPHIPGYQILGELGHGGMGVVYKARQLALNRIVAIKMLRGFISRGELARFMREAEMAAGLQHTHIVHIYEVGSVEGRPYFSMEYLDGGTLASKQAGGPMPAREAAALVETLARAVHFANRQGIVHRDLKPANVLFAGDGCPKIGDFGIAKRIEEESNLTQSGMVMGTPAYMAPEQARGANKEVGAAADVYALGAILYELLAGRPPFLPDESDLHLTHRILTEDPISPAFHRPTTPADLEAICLKCLQKHPADRYASAAALAEDLRRFLEDEPVLARRPGRVRRSLKWVRRHPLKAAGWAICCLALAATAWGFWYMDAFRWERVEYYANFVPRWGEFQGVGGLTTEQAHRRQLILKAHRRGRRGPVTSYQYFTGHETFTEEMPPIRNWINGFFGGVRVPAVQMEYKFDETGRVTEEIGRTDSGRVAFRFQYDYTADNLGGDPRRSVYGRFVSASAYELSSEFGASIVHIIRDEHGLDRKVAFLDGKGQPRRNADGVYGMEIEHDAVGNMTRVTNLDADGKPMKNYMGIVQLAMDYDRFGNPLTLSYFSFGGKPAPTAGGISCYKSQWDERSGNITRVTAYGPDGTRVLDKQAGWSAKSCRYDEHGNLIELRYLGLGDEPVNVSEMAYAVDRKKYDDRGNMLEDLHLDKDGKFAARFTYEYDEYNRPAKLCHWGADGKQLSLWQAYEYNARGSRTAVLTWKGEQLWQQTRTKYDEQQRPTEEIYLDGKGLPRPDADGCSSRTIAYGPGDGVTTTTLRGFDTKVKGFYSMKRVTNIETNVIDETCYDEQGNPVACRDGYARRVTRRDAQLHVVEVSYFDRDGAPSRDNEGYGYSHATALYDAAGVEKETTFDGINPDLRGFASERCLLAPNGSVAEEQILGKDGKPAVSADGYSKAVYARDAQGNVIGVSLFDLDSGSFAAEVYVRAVIPGKSGAKAGVAVGDVLVTYDGKPVRDWFVFQDVPAKGNTDPKHEMTVLRDGQTRTFHLSGEIGLFVSYRPAPPTRSATTRASATIPAASPATVP